MDFFSATNAIAEHRFDSHQMAPCGCGGTSTAGRPQRGGPVQHVDLSDAVRHLTYHIWPTKGNDCWRWNLEQLAARWPLFNGRKVVGIAYDYRSEFPDTVLKECDRLGIRWDHVIQRRNTTKLGEVKTWPLRLSMLYPETCGPDEVVFAAHAKGVRHQYGAVIPWTQTMYECCLDDWDTVRQQLEWAIFTGAFQQDGPFQPGIRWHYSGSFYWFRLADIGRRNWQNIEHHYAGTETWPWLMVNRTETGCLFARDCGNLYATQHQLREEWETERESRRRQQQGAGSQVGTRLSAIIRERVGESPCADCRAAIQQLNGMTGYEGAAQRSQIVADFAANAAQRTASWWLGLALRADQLTGGAGAAYCFGRWLDEAVEAERHARAGQDIRGAVGAS